jgi:O-antigen ligase
LVLSGILIGIFISAYYIFPGVFDRLNSIVAISNQPIDKTSSESTAVRVLIWEQSLDLIKNNFILGTGVGDANDSLYEAYKTNGLIGAYEHRFNAHSQYFQTFIGLGLIGIALLLMMTFWQLITSIVKKRFLHLIFAFLIVTNFFVESMLQTAAGVLFFAFFYCFFNLINEEQLKTE